MTRTRKHWLAKQVPGTEERKEIRRNCLEWGIFPDDDSSHRAFEGAVARAVEEAQQLGKISLPFVQETRTISPRFEVAAREVLVDNVENAEEVGGGYTLVDDVLKEGECGAPFFVLPEKFHRREQWVVKLKPSMTRQARSAFDPLNRFTSESVSAKEYYEDWVENPTSGEVGGLVFEGIVVSFAVHNIPCRCCSHKTLRWTGGSTPFSDMECLTCQSVYEIKSKRSLEMIDKQNQYGFRGGSYRGWWCLRGQKRRAGWKCYLVVVSRSRSLLRGETDFFWPVQVAEIERVFPQLCCYSFVPNMNGCSMQLKTVIRTQSKTEPWFQIPYEFIDYEGLVRSVLRELVPEIFQEASSESQEDNNGAKVAELGDLLLGLEVADDWEDLADDES